MRWLTCLAIVVEENELAPGAPAVNSAKKVRPLRDRTTRCGLPDLPSRMVMVPASALKFSGAHAGKRVASRDGVIGATAN